MKKPALILFTVLLLEITAAQDYNTAIGLKLLPSVTTHFNADAKIDDRRYWRFSPNAEVSVRQRVFKDFLYVESGVALMDRGYVITSTIRDRNGENPRERMSEEFNYYVTIPLSIVARAGHWYFGVGPNINFYVHRRYVSGGELITTDKNPYMANHGFGGQAFAEYNFNLSDHFILTGSAFINPMFDPKFLNYVNYGLGVGINYTFGDNPDGE